jgi:hypothetical protein
MLCHGTFFYVVLHVTIINTHGAASDFIKNLIVTGKICIKLRNVLLYTDFTILSGITRTHVVTVIIIRRAVLHKSQDSHTLYNLYYRAMSILIGYDSFTLQANALTNMCT